MSVTDGVEMLLQGGENVQQTWHFSTLYFDLTGCRLYGCANPYVSTHPDANRRSHTNIYSTLGTFFTDANICTHDGTGRTAMGRSGEMGQRGEWASI